MEGKCISGILKLKIAFISFVMTDVSKAQQSPSPGKNLDSVNYFLFRLKFDFFNFRNNDYVATGSDSGVVNIYK